MGPKQKWVPKWDPKSSPFFPRTYSGPIRVPFGDPFSKILPGVGRGPGDPFLFGAHLGPLGTHFLRAESWSVGALGPILGRMIHGDLGPWDPFGGRRPTEWGFGGGAPDAGVRGRQPPGAPRGLVLRAPDNNKCETNVK